MSEMNVITSTEKIEKIVAIVGVFQVYMKNLPEQRVLIKIWKESENYYAGKPNIYIKDEHNAVIKIQGQGNSLEEAFHDTVERLVHHMGKIQVGREAYFEKVQLQDFL